MSDPSPARRLADEHALLLDEVSVRQQRTLDALAAGRWPEGEIEALLAFLRYELLDQAVNEERLLYPLTPEGFTDPRIHQLVEDHVHLRNVADELAGAATAAAPDRDGDRLVAVLRDLRERLDQHLRAEQEVLSPVTAAGVEALRQPFRSLEWFALTDGPVVDMDRLPPAFAHSATLERLSRLRAGERIELHSSGRLETLHALFTRGGLTGEYGWVYLQEGPDRWAAEITRRAVSP